MSSLIFQAIDWQTKTVIDKIDPEITKTEIYVFGKTKDKEDVLYDIKDEPDVPPVPKQVEKTVDSQTKSNLSDDDINKIVELLESRINATKEGEADGN